MIQRSLNRELYTRTVSIINNINNYVLLICHIISGNNLYRWAMSQYMPYNRFKWVEPTLDGLETLTDT
jgi:hypothetical protein